MGKRFDEAGNIIPEAGTVADKAHFLANVQGMAFCYFLGGAQIKDFRFVARENVSSLPEGIQKLWNETLGVVKRFAPYDFSRAYDSGESSFLVSISFPCWDGWNFQYRTSGQSITINDVVDAMFEIMDVCPRPTRYLDSEGQKWFRFSWMFLESDIERLMNEFPNVDYTPCWQLPMRETFREMDRKLNLLARKAANVYPFLECEFYGW